MPSTALKEHEYEIAELVIADKWHERQLTVNMKWIKKKISEEIQKTTDQYT